MASAPHLKVFNPSGEYIAACKFYEDAAALAALNGNGSSVRLGHSKKDTLWMEGSERISAAESYDEAAQIMRERKDEICDRNLRRLGCDVVTTVR